MEFKTHINEEIESLNIIITLGVVNVEYQIWEPRMFSPHKWKTFMERAKLGECEQLVFCDSNGTVSLESCKKELIFTVAKHGAGGDGIISVEVAKEFCMSSLEKYVEGLLNSSN